jgi:hypothetical protein
MTSSTAKKSNKTTKDRVDKLRAAAKKNVAQRGTVQYRLDEETMSRLMKVADAKKTPVGVLARMWMVERLDHEESK